MKFARWIFGIAGVWGVAVLTPLFFMEKYANAKYPPAMTHPEFYYGFVCVGLAAQFMFLIIATDPLRYRPLMFVAMWEKFSAVGAVLALGFMGRIPSQVASGIIFDLILGVLFVVAWVKTKGINHEGHEGPQR